MAELLSRLRAWWSKDTVEEAREEATMTQAERDVVEEDYEARLDDERADARGLAGGVDFERDSEPPSDPAR